MSETERNKLLEMLRKATEKTKKLSQGEAMQKLVDEGYYTVDGKLTAKYGGKSKPAA